MRAFFSLFFACWLFNLFLPWWGCVIPVLFLAALMLENSLQAFVIGFTASGLAWLVQAGYIHIANEGVLTTRIADMMSVGSPLIVLFITFLIGGLLGGVSALSGVLIKQNLNTSQPDNTQTVN